MQNRILVVEDDHMQRDILTAFLEKHDFVVDSTDSGTDAVFMCRTGWFNIVLMDYRIAEMDCHSSATLIKDALSSFGTSPQIIALTLTPERATASEAGGDPVFAAILRKPWEPELLLRTIRLAQAAAPGAAVGGIDGGAVIAHSPDAGRIGLGDADPSDSTVPRILVVEEDDAMRTSLEAALEIAGYEVAATGDGLEAIRLLTSRHFDVAILDYFIPKIDGHVTAQLVRRLVPIKRWPHLICLTAVADFVQALEGGGNSVFDYVIARPTPIDAVLRAVQDGIRNGQRRSNSDSINILEMSTKLAPGGFSNHI